MAQEIDLYSILMVYADKSNSSFIMVDSFLEHLESLAKKQPAANSPWFNWVKDRGRVFWAELNKLVEEGKCELITQGDISQIYLPTFYIELLTKAYQNTDGSADLPFFSEESLKIVIPEKDVMYLGSEYDLLTLLERTGEHAVQILKITFPDDFGSAVALTSLFPRKLGEMAINKIKNYLLRSENKEYVYNKLAPQLHGREVYLREHLDKIVKEPNLVYADIEAGGELSYLFWTHFCSVAKSDIKKKRERLPMDVAAYQSAFLIDAINKYYKALAAKNLEVETAFRNLESILAKAPYMYTMDEIIKFTNPKGEPLLGKYSNDELNTWLRKNITENEADGRLPRLVVVPGYVKDDQCFILKEKIPSLCGRYIVDGRLQVKDAVMKYWKKMILDYRKDRAMDNDVDFEKLLMKFVEKSCPELLQLLANPKFLLAYQEIERNDNSIAYSDRIFAQGRLLPYSMILKVQRRDTLRDVRFSVPFWYYMPIISDIIGFFARSFGTRTSTPVREREEAPGERGAQQEQNRSLEIRSAAKELETALIPQGLTLAFYMEKLEDRWSRLLLPKARSDLITDVNSLVRDYMRQTMRLQKQFKPTRGMLNEMASELANRNQALASLRDREALVLYLELLMIKYLKNIR